MSRRYDDPVGDFADWDYARECAEEAHAERAIARLRRIKDAQARKWCADFQNAIREGIENDPFAPAVGAA